MKKIKIGIIGCGKVAHIHAAALQALKNSEFVGVCSRDEQRAKLFAGQYQVSPYTNLDTFLSQSGIEAVIICTPHPFHLLPAVRAAKNGIHVLVEKPLASSLADCDEMIKVAKNAGVKLGVISQRRFYEPVHRVKKAIEENKIGKPILATVTMLGWRDQNYYQSNSWRGTWKEEGGGVLVNQAPHQLDLLQWFLGPIDELYGMWANLNHLYLEVEDTALAVIRFKNGALGNIVLSNSQNPALYGNVHLHGDNGASIGVQTDGGAMFIAGMTTIEEPPLNDLWTIPGESHFLEKWKKEDTEYFKTIEIGRASCRERV